MGVKANKDAIVLVLNGLVGAGQPLEAVYGYMNPTIEKLPCALVNFAEGGRDIRLDTSANWLSSFFAVYIVFRESKTQADVDQVYTTLDQVLDVFNSSSNVDTLGGAVESFNIESIDPVQFQEATVMMGFRILISMSEIYPFT